MKERFDKSAARHKFSVGDYVFMYIPSLLVKKVSRKLQATFSGPYLLLKFHSPSTVILKRVQDGYRLKNPVHVERLRSLLSGVSKQSIARRIEKGYTSQLLNPDKVSTTQLVQADAKYLQSVDRVLDKPVRSRNSTNCAHGVAPRQDSPEVMSAPHTEAQC